MFVWTRGLREYIASTLGIVTIDIEGVGSTTRGFNNQCAPRFVMDRGHLRSLRRSFSTSICEFWSPESGQNIQNI